MFSANSLLTNKIRINQDICGIFSSPAALTQYPAVLFLHGFASDKDEVNKIYQYMANGLNQKNIATLRIDFRCWGESAGKTEESTIDKMIEDAVTAINYLKNLKNVDPDNVAIIGFSLGAAIAMLATQFVYCKSLFLISPALNLKYDFINFLGEENMQQLRESTGPIEINLSWRKVKISKNLYISLQKHDPLLSVEKFKGELYCIAGKNDFTSSNASKIIKKSQATKKKLSIIDGGDHIFNLPNSKNILVDVADDIVAEAYKVLGCNKRYNKP